MGAYGNHLQQPTEKKKASNKGTSNRKSQTSGKARCSNEEGKKKKKKRRQTFVIFTKLAGMTIGHNKEVLAAVAYMKIEQCRANEKNFNVFILLAPERNALQLMLT